MIDPWPVVRRASAYEPPRSSLISAPSGAAATPSATAMQMIAPASTARKSRPRTHNIRQPPNIRPPMYGQLVPHLAATNPARELAPFWLCLQCGAERIQFLPLREVGHQNR